MKLETGKMVVVWGFPNQLVPIIGMITCIKTENLNAKREVKIVTVYDSIKHHDINVHDDLDCNLYNYDFVSLWSLGGFFIRLMVTFLIIVLLLLSALT